MTKIDTTCEHIKIRLIAAAVGLQHCTQTAANIVPLPGGDRVIAIGTPAEVVQALVEDPLDLPLPCDVTVGAGTIKKGCKLRTLVTRMETLHGMAMRAYAAPSTEQAPAIDWIYSVVRDVSELERDSPEGEPDMMLVTADELFGIIRRRAPSPTAAGAGSAQPRAEGDERALFEIAFKLDTFQKRRHATIEGDYQDQATQCAWTGWQIGRAALARAPLPAQGGARVDVQQTIANYLFKHTNLSAESAARAATQIAEGFIPEAQPVDDARATITISAQGARFPDGSFINSEGTVTGPLAEAVAEKIRAAMRANDSAAEGGADQPLGVTDSEGGHHD